MKHKIAPIITVAFTLGLIIFVINSCKKNTSGETLDDGSPGFNVAAAKKWYNNTFKNSQEWQNYYSAIQITAQTPNPRLHGNKSPEWTNSHYRKVGNIEIIEVPLAKQIKNFSLPSDLPNADAKKVAAASLARVAFIKRGNDIFVREIDYIPDWQYLNEKNFDISEGMVGKQGNDFKGRIIVKNWSDDVITSAVLDKGKIIKMGKIRPRDNTGSVSIGNVANSEPGNCPNVCVYQNDHCSMSEYGDGMVVDNGCDPNTWYNTGDCEPDANCDNEPSECDGDSENCACMLYGMGCDVPPPVENPCQESPQNAQVTLDALTGNAIGDYSYTMGEEKVDVNGIIRQPVTVDFPIFHLTTLDIQYMGHGSGIRYKNTPSDRWKWESFEKSTNTSHTNTYPACYADEMKITLSNPVLSEDGEKETMALHYDLSLSLSCLGGLRVRSFSGDHPVLAYANQ